MATDEINIDDHFVRVGGKSYAIDKINSVEVRAGKPKGKGPAIGAAIAAVAVLFAGVAGFIVALILGFIAWRLWQDAGKRNYQLFLMTSSGEAEAVQTTDAGEIARLREAIEGAMRRRPK